MDGVPSASSAAPSAPIASSAKEQSPTGSFRINARGWIFLVLTLSVAFAAAFKGNNLLFAIFSVLFGIFLVSGFLTLLVCRKLEISRVLPETAFNGELFTVGLRVKNRKRFWPAFCLRIEDQLSHEGRPCTLQPTPVGIAIARAGRQARGAAYVSAQERGWAQLGPLRITSEFPPALFTYRLTIPVIDRLLVYPRMATLNRRLIPSLFSRVEYVDVVSNDFVAGAEEFSGLREYRPGDNPRRIHWKMSARLPGRLLVREYEDPRIRDATILLETFVPNPNDPRRRLRLERAITFAATLAETLLARNCRVAFRAFAPEPVTLSLEPRRGSIEELLRVLAELQPTRTRTLMDLIASAESDAPESGFALRIADDPLPAIPKWAVLEPGDMKNLMMVNP